MCLSTAYQDIVSPDHIMMKNVMSLEVKEDRVILKDLMERTLSIPGQLKEVNLVDGIVVLTHRDEEAVQVGRADL